MRLTDKQKAGGQGGRRQSQGLLQGEQKARTEGHDVLGMWSLGNKQNTEKGKQGESQEVQGAGEGRRFGRNTAGCRRVGGPEGERRFWESNDTIGGLKSTDKSRRVMGEGLRCGRAEG